MRTDDFGAKLAAMEAADDAAQAAARALAPDVPSGARLVHEFEHRRGAWTWVERDTPIRDAMAREIAAYIDAPR